MIVSRFSPSAFKLFDNLANTPAIYTTIFSRSVPSFCDILICSSVASEIVMMSFSSIVGGKYEQLAAVTMSVSSFLAMFPLVPVVFPALAMRALNMLLN